MSRALALVHKVVKGRFYEKPGEISFQEACCDIIINDEKRAIAIEPGQVWDAPDGTRGTIASFDNETHCWTLLHTKFSPPKRFGDSYLKMFGHKIKDAEKVTV